MNANDSPVFAFARLCDLTIPANRPARSVKIVSDLLVSSLQAPPMHDRGEHITPSSAHGSPAVRGRAGDLVLEKEV